MTTTDICTAEITLVGPDGTRGRTYSAEHVAWNANHRQVVDFIAAFPHGTEFRIVVSREVAE